MIDPAPSPCVRFFPWLLGALLIGYVTIHPLQLAGAQTQSTIRDDSQLNSDLPQPSDRNTAHLYFADRNNSFLKSELRIMPQSDDPVEFGRAIIDALIKGPQKGLIRTIPDGTELSAIYIGPNDVCYVDLSGPIRTKHSGGVKSELLTIYSVVNSLILNVSEIKRVKILIEGNEAPTLAGHINLQLPFRANMLLIR